MNIWFTIHLDLSQQSPDGPGWYLSAHRRDGHDEGPVTLIDPQRLTDLQLGQFDDIEIDDAPVAISQIVASGVHLINEAIDAQIEEAEAMIERAARLKALRRDVQPNDKDVKE